MLESSTYGKDNVKFLKVIKDPSNPKVHQVIEVSCCVLLTGNFDVSYTEADNAPIVPTDTVKNTILVLGKTTKVWPIETFAVTLSQHFLNKYSHVSGVDVYIEQLPWSKITDPSGKKYDHSFVKAGNELRTATCHATRQQKDFKLVSGVKDLTVLKSTNSMFYGFNKCDYTTLGETKDRILSTDIDASWEWDTSKVNIHTVGELASPQGTGFESIFKNFFDNAFNSVKEITYDLFATQNSPSVQATMYDMSMDILKTNPLIKTVSYSLPNKHYFLIDLKWKGLDNDNELFYPSWHPNGLIKCTVGRDSKSKL